MKSFDATSIAPHELLRALVENTAAAIYVKALDGRYLSVNRTCEQLWGMDRAAIIGKSDHEMLPEVSADIVRAHDLQVMDSGRPDQFEEIIEFAAGTRVFLSSKSPLYDESGAVRGICGISTDITARYAFEDALRRSQDQLSQQASQLAELHQRKDQFLAVMAHELRNPLAPIRHAAELMSSPRARVDQIAAAAAVIGRQVSHMARLIDELMDAARLTRGRIELRTADVTVAHVFERASEMVAAELAERGHTLDRSISDESMVVQGDPDRLVQIVGNLLENAVRFSERPGAIWLDASRQGNTVRIVVRDEGCGIAPERMEHLFEPFARNGVPHQSPGGLGLGLVIVKQLVDLHGGSVRVESDGPGRGCQFTVELPLTEASPDAAVAEEQATEKGKVSPHRILVVDDNQDAAELLADMLALDGHQVSVCFSGHEVADSVRKAGADIVLLDIGLPDLDGYQVARMLRAEYGSVVQLIAVTGYGRDSDREQSREAGFDHHLVKPMDFASLRRLLHDSTVPDR